MSFKLVIVEPAEFDVDFIYRYISERSSQGAATWYRELEGCLARIVDQPFSCSFAPENPKFPFELRQAIFKTRYGDPYRCVFTIVENEVRVLRVRGRGHPWLIGYYFFCIELAILLLLSPFIANSIRYAT